MVAAYSGWPSGNSLIMNADYDFPIGFSSNILGFLLPPTGISSNGCEVLGGISSTCIKTSILKLSIIPSLVSSAYEPEELYGQAEHHSQMDTQKAETYYPRQLVVHRKYYYLLEGSEYPAVDSLLSDLDSLTRSFELYSNYIN